MTVRHIPADGTQTAAQGIAALLVQTALGLYHVQRAGQGGDGGFLHRQEHAEIDLTAQLFKGGYHVPPAHKEADAGTGDVEAFGKTEELHAHIHGTRRVEEAVAHGPVKDDVAVGIVVDDEDVVLLCKGHQLGVQLRRAHAAHRVCGQGDDHVLCLAGHIFRDVLHVRQEAMLFGQRIIPGFCAAQQTARNEHRVAGGGQQHGVALVAQHHADVAHALLTAGAAGYLIRRDLHAEAALVVAAHSIQQLRQVAQAVLPVLRVGGCVHHGLADVLGRRKVRCADAQIINGTALSFQFHLAFVQCGEDLVAEQVQSFGKFHDTIPLKSSCFQHEPF